MIKTDVADAIFQKNGNGFYLISEERLNLAYQLFEKTFRDRYPNIQTAYSFKTCNLDYILCKLREYGAWAEVTSDYEYKMAVAAGYGDNQIVYNGPYKNFHLAHQITRAGGIVNLDSMFEVEEYCRLLGNHDSGASKVGLRCNFDIDGRGSRFGIDTQSECFSKALQYLSEHHVTVNCLLFHIRCKSFDQWKAKVENAIQIAKRVRETGIAATPFLLDFGGGYVYDTESFQKYAEIISEGVNSLQDDTVKIVLEPGAALVEGAVDFYAKVVNTNLIQGTKYITVTGTMNDISAIRRKPPGELLLLSRNGKKTDVKALERQYKVAVAGFTCLEEDILEENYFDDPEPGDYIVFKNVGAYSSSLRSDFIRTAPTVAVETLNNRILFA